MFILLFLLILIVSILIYFYRIRSQWYIKYQQNLSKMIAEGIYHHLYCFEFPFECFYGINLAFYRTFVSPSIASVYTQTKTLEREAEKRVYDTDILVHAWIDYGLDSDEGRASFKHLNRIHGVFSNLTRNEDFVFILCCLIVDNIRTIDIFGWRSLNDVEKEAIFRFYEQVGERMNLKNRPKSLKHAHTIVNDYIYNDIHSKDTTFGRVLTNSVTTVVEKWYSPFVPASLVRLVLGAIIYIIGGQTFHQKLGFKQSSPIIVATVYTLATIRRYLIHFMPPRRNANRISNILMNNGYKCSALKADFLQVGPQKLIATFNKTQTNR